VTLVRAGEQEGGGAVVDPLDVDLEDSDLLGEVELTAALIVAANQADERLSTTEIDRVLGLFPADDTAEGADRRE
jgi:hypothetical protein